MKKTLVVLLALMMVFAFAATAMAADEQYVPYNDIADQDVDIQTAIERLTILGALKGYDAEGTRFAPSQLITREEFATIGVRIAGMEDQVALYASMASAFKDVEEGRWSEGYINAANANGIMIGRGNGIFDPKANVTMQEVATVLLRAVGYDDRLPGAWPSDYNTKAVNVGITEYVDYIGPKAATRGEVASLVNETLDLWTVQYVEDTTGLGQIIGGVIQWIDGVNIPVVDKDNYMYVIDATNEEGNYGTTLLNQTFDADVVSARFDDDGEAMSEAYAWGFEDFEDWELYANAQRYVFDDNDDEWQLGNVTPIEFASLYGVSRGQDITDLGYQEADLTINADGEIIYVDLTSDVVRTADVTKDQHKDTNNQLAEGGYGEIWYDADGNAYAWKNFAEFDEAKYGIVDDVDKYSVYFKNDADLATAKLADLDLDENIAFYLVGEGFIEATDLEEGDVIYTDDLASDDDILALVFRPTEGTLDKLASTYVEIDDVDYDKVEDFSFFSADSGATFEAYTLASADEIAWGDKVSFVPAYAFNTFAYFSDDVAHYNIGVLDSYELADGNYRVDEDFNDYKLIKGMNVMLADQDKLTYIEFEDELLNYLGELIEEGSLIEFVVDGDGVCTGFKTANNGDILGHAWQNGRGGDKFAAMSDAGIHGGATEAVWSKNYDDRLDLTIDVADPGADVNQTFRFAKDAVIFVVESESASWVPQDKHFLYAFDSAKAYTVDAFQKEYGDFSARDICLYDENNGTISVMYVCDIDKEAAVSYGFGLYQGEHYKSVSGNSYILEIGDQLVKIEKDAYNRLVGNGFENSIGLIAYEMNDGIIVDGTLGNTFDMFLFEGCYNIDGKPNAEYGIDAWIAEHEGFADVYDYQYVCGDIASFGANGTLTLNNLNGDEDDDDNYFYINDAEDGDYIAGYDFTGDTAKELKVSDLKAYAEVGGKHALVVTDNNQGNDASVLYILVFNADDNAHVQH